MSDLINRRAALEALDEINAEIEDGDGFDFEKWREFFCNMPSAQPTDADIQKMQDIEQAMLEKAYECGKQDAAQWIPCSERLPEEKTDVLLAFKNNMAVGFWEDILRDGVPAWYANSGDGWITDTENVDSDGIPIAWMPLPEPYREVSE